MEFWRCQPRPAASRSLRQGHRGHVEEVGRLLQRVCLSDRSSHASVLHRRKHARVSKRDRWKADAGSIDSGRGVCAESSRPTYPIVSWVFLLGLLCLLVLTSYLSTCQILSANYVIREEFLVWGWCFWCFYFWNGADVSVTASSTSVWWFRRKLTHLVYKPPCFSYDMHNFRY